MSVATDLKSHWLKIALALISAGLTGEIFGVWKFNSELSSTDKKYFTEQLQHCIERTDVIQRDCNDRVSEMQTELSMLKANAIVTAAIATDLPLPMWIKDMNGKMLYLNDEYEKIFLIPRGVRALNYIGNDDFSVWPKKIAEEFRKNDVEAFNSSHPIKRVVKIPNERNGFTNYVVIK